MSPFSLLSLTSSFDSKSERLNLEACFCNESSFNFEFIFLNQFCFVVQTVYMSQYLFGCEYKANLSYWYLRDINAWCILKTFREAPAEHLRPTLQERHCFLKIILNLPSFSTPLSVVAECRMLLSSSEGLPKSRMMLEEMALREFCFYLGRFWDINSDNSNACGQ